MAARSGRGHHRGAAAWTTAWSWHSGCLQNERRQAYVSHFEVPCRAQDCPALQQLRAVQWLRIAGISITVVPSHQALQLAQAPPWRRYGMRLPLFLSSLGLFEALAVRVAQTRRSHEYELGSERLAGPSATHDKDPSRAGEVGDWLYIPSGWWHIAQT